MYLPCDAPIRLDYESRSVDTLFQAAEHVFGATESEIKAHLRREPRPTIRAILMSFLRFRVGLSFNAVGAILDRTHDTAFYHCKAHEGRLEADRAYRVSWDAFCLEYDKITTNLKCQEHVNT